MAILDQLAARISRDIAKKRLSATYSENKTEMAAAVSGPNLARVGGNLAATNDTSETNIGKVISVVNVGRPAMAVYQPATGGSLVLGRSSGSSATTSGDNHPTVTLATPSGLEFGSQISQSGLAIADTLAGNGLTISQKVLSVGAGSMISVAADTVGITPGIAHQFISTNASAITQWRDISELAGDGMIASAGILAVELSAASGLELTGTSPAKTLQIADTVAGNGLAISNKILSVGVANTIQSAAGAGLSVEANALRLTAGYNPGVAPSILATDATGKLTIPLFEATTSIKAPLLTTASGDLTIDPAGVVAFPVTQTIKTPDFRSAYPILGWQINEVEEIAGQSALTIGKIAADELRVKVFVADETRVDRGNQYWTKSYGIVAEPFVTPSAIGGTVTIIFEDSPAIVGAIFTPNDWILFRLIDITTGLIVASIWGQVSNYLALPEDPELAVTRQSWTFTLRAGPTSTPIKAGRTAVDFGASGDALIHLSVLDIAGAPYISMRRWEGADPYSPANHTTYVHIGNLNSISSESLPYAPEGYGLYVRSKTNAARAILADNHGLLIQGADFKLFNGATQTFNISYTGDSFWIGPSSADKRLHWDNTTLNIKGSVTATAGYIGGTSGTSGWTIETGKLTSTNIELTSGESARLQVGSGSLFAGVAAGSATDDVVFWAGDTYALRATTGAEFRVKLGGQLYATGATLSGAITATSGTITGDFSVTSGGKLSASGGGIVLTATGINIGSYPNVETSAEPPDNSKSLTWWDNASTQSGLLARMYASYDISPTNGAYWAIDVAPGTAGSNGSPGMFIWHQNSNFLWFNNIQNVVGIPGMGFSKSGTAPITDTVQVGANAAFWLNSGSEFKAWTHLIPGEDLAVTAYNLGSATKRWGTLYVGEIKAGNIEARSSSVYDIGRSGEPFKKIYVDEVVALTITGGTALAGHTWQRSDAGDMYIKSYTDTVSRTLFIANSGTASMNLDVEGNIVVGGTVDGVDLSAFKSAYDTHAGTADTHVAHSNVDFTAGAGLTGGGTTAASRNFAVGAGTMITVNANDVAITAGATYQFIGTGSGTAPGWRDVSELAGAGLTAATGVLAVGAGTLISIAADTVGIATGATYQFISTGSGTAAGWRDISELAGAGLTATTGILAVGAGLGITVNANDVALTTPGELTATTTNSSTGSHTHSIATAAATTLAVGTLNAVGTSTSLARADHLHTITSSADPGAATSLLKSDATGKLTLPLIVVSTSLTTPLIVAGTGQSLTLQPPVDLFLNPTSNVVKLAGNRSIQSESFNSGFAGNGWRVDLGVTSAPDTTHSNAEFDNLTVRGMLRVYELVIQQIRATNGSIFVTSAAKVDDVSLVSGASYDLTVDGTANDYQPFAVGDVIRAQRVNLGALLPASPTLTDFVYRSDLVVTAINVGGDAKKFRATWQAGSTVPAEGMEFVRLGNASDIARQGAVYLTSDDSGAPFIDIMNGITSHADWNTAGKIKVRLGKLDGIVGGTNEYGLIAGNNGFTLNDTYLKASSAGVVLNNVPLDFRSGGNIVMALSPNSGAPYMALGSPLPTGPLTNNGIWAGKDNNDYEFRVGAVSGGVLTNGLHWDGTVLYVGNVSAAHIWLDGTTLKFKDGSTVYTDLTAGALTLGRIANSNSRIEITSGAINIINRSAAGADTTAISLSSSGNASFTGEINANSGNIAGTLAMGTGGKITTDRLDIDVSGASVRVSTVWNVNAGYRFNNAGTQISGSFGYSDASSNYLSLITNKIVTGGTIIEAKNAHTIVEAYADTSHAAYSYLQAATYNSGVVYRFANIAVSASYNTNSQVAITADSFIFNSNTVWHAGNDGASSGLDADTLDTYHASSFALLSGPTFSGHLKVGTGAAYDLGEASVKWRTLYVGSIVADTISGASLSGATWRNDASDMYIYSSSAGTRTLWLANDGAGVMDLAVDGSITVGGNVDGVDVSAFKTAYDSHNHDSRYYTETEIDAHTGATTAHGATGAVVGTTNTQTLTNKTLGATSFTGLATLGAHLFVASSGTFSNAANWDSVVDVYGSGHSRIAARTSSIQLDITAHGSEGWAGAPAGAHILTSTNHPLSFGTNGGVRMTIAGSTGYVGINKTDPGYPLDVSGYGRFSLGTIFNNGKTWDISGNGNNLNVNETGIRTLMTFKAGGNVGIGTTDPGYELEVKVPVATSKDGGRIYLNCADYGYVISGGLQQGSGAYLQFDRRNVAAGVAVMHMDSNGNVGIGTTDPAEKLQVTGNLAFRSAGSSAYENLGQIFWRNTGNTANNASIWARRGGGNYGSASLIFETASVDSGTTERMRIGENGNVGIGRSDPTSLLHLGTPNTGWTTAGWGKSLEMVNASAIKWGANAGGYRHGIGQTTDGLYFIRSTADDTSAGALYTMVLNNAGRVGIGTTNPGARLEVAGDVEVGSNNLFGWRYSADDANMYNQITNAYGGSGSEGIAYRAGAYTGGQGIISHRFQTYTSGWVDRLVIRQDGNVGIGTTSPGYKLDVASGDINISAGQGFRSNGVWNLGTDVGNTQLSLGSQAIARAVGIYSQGNATPAFYATTGGKVGIGRSDPTYTLDVSGTGRFTGALQLNSNLDVDGAAQFDDNLYVGSNVLYVNRAGTRVGINRIPDSQFSLDVAGAIRGDYLVGAHAIQLPSAVGVFHFDGPAPYNLNFNGTNVSHMGKGGIATGSIVYRPSNFGKAVQVAEGTTNLLKDPSFELGAKTYWTDYAVNYYLNTNSLYGGLCARFSGPGSSGAYQSVYLPNGTYTYSAWVFIESIGSVETAPCVYIQSHGAGDALVAADHSKPNQWQRISITFTVTTGYVTCYILTTASCTWRADGMQLEAKGYATPYHDGSMTTPASWDGTPHASSSTRVASYINYSGMVNRSSYTVGGWFRQGLSQGSTAGSDSAWKHKFFQVNNYYGNPSCTVGTWGHSASVQLLAKNTVDSAWAVSADVQTGFSAHEWIFVALTWDGYTHKVYVHKSSSTDSWYTAEVASGTGFYGSGSDLWLYVDPAYGNDLIDELFVLDYAAENDLLHSIALSKAPVFVESSVFHWRAPGAANIWVDERGFWASSLTNAAVFGIYTGDPAKVDTYKSWGGINLEDNDILIGRSPDGYVHWDDSAATLRIKGVITADSGYIGTAATGWAISSGLISSYNIGLFSGGANAAHIRVGNGANAAGLNSADASTDWTIWSGSSHADRATAKFRVRADGKVWATDATIEGAITANSGSIAGVLTMGASGGIYQGTGTFASPTTGMKIWNDSSVGRIAGYNAGTAQWYAGTDGKLYAGSGNVSLSATGISVVASTSSFDASKAYTFTQSDTQIGGMFLVRASETTALYIQSNSVIEGAYGAHVESNRNGGVYLSGIGHGTGKAGLVSITAQMNPGRDYPARLSLYTPYSGEIYAMLTADKIYMDGETVMSGGTIIPEFTDTPPAPANGTEVRMYMRNNNLIFQFNDGGTVRYKYMPLNGTGYQFYDTTTPP